jgi:hypothetical protein
MSIKTKILSELKQIDPALNSVIVYDIDDTLIHSNTGQPKTDIVEVYHESVKMNFTPVIITARPGTEKNIEITMNQLKNIGIHSPLVYFRPENKWDVSRFKLLARKNIHERGYIVEASIGDMHWDIGAYGGKGFIV